MNVHVQPLDATTFEVSISGSTPTTHRVSVSLQDAKRLTGGKITTAELVARSFDFLLEREPNTSILRQFDLTVIGRYFPEYERVIASSR